MDYIGTSLPSLQHEILSIHLGQAGVQIGSAIWELYCAEHNIKADGFPTTSHDMVNDVHFETFFQLTRKERYVARSLFIDLDQTTIDEIRSGPFFKLHHKDNLVSGLEDASNNFARGCFTLGKEICDKSFDRVRKSLELCDYAEGIMLFRSLGGGTGSGVTSALFDYISDYGRLTRVEVPIYPSPMLSTSAVEPYNCLLGEHFCMDDIDISLLFDNEAMYSVCSRYLSMGTPTYSNLNRLMAQVVSSLTSSMRFENVLSSDLSVMQTNLIPYPRLHFPLINYAPLINNVRGSHEALTTEKITRYLFERENQMVKCQPGLGKYMSCAIIYRGNISPQDIYKTICEMKSQKDLLRFVEWCPTGFKMGIITQPSTQIPGSLITPSEQDAVMISNNSAISEVIHRLTQKFAMLYSKRSFVHWFVGDGLEEVEFTEALYNMATLVKDYQESTKDIPVDNAPMETYLPPTEKIADEEESG